MHCTVLCVCSCPCCAAGLPRTKHLEGIVSSNQRQSVPGPGLTDQFSLRPGWLPPPKGISPQGPARCPLLPLIAAGLWCQSKRTAVEQMEVPILRDISKYFPGISRRSPSTSFHHLEQGCECSAAIICRLKASQALGLPCYFCYPAIMYSAGRHYGTDHDGVETSRVGELPRPRQCQLGLARTRLIVHGNTPLYRMRK